jgi:hypothetical protein
MEPISVDFFLQDYSFLNDVSFTEIKNGMSIYINNTHSNRHTLTHTLLHMQSKKILECSKAAHFIMNLFIWHGSDYFKGILGEYLHAFK